MNIKLQLYTYCIEDINQRLTICSQSIASLQNSLSAETKSSAGDKHETGRAMIQLEREQLGKQLALLEKEQAILLKINPDLSSPKIQLGSVIYTTQQHYFIATSIGKIIMENEVFYALSPQAPIGQLLMGKSKGDEFNFRNEKIKIVNVI